MSKPFHPLYDFILFTIFCFTDVLKSSSKKFNTTYVALERIQGHDRCQSRARRDISLSLCWIMN